MLRALYPPSSNPSTMATLRHIYILAALSFGLLAHGCSPPLTQPANQSPAIFFELEKELSPGAAVVTPGPEHQRWSAYASPTYSIVVEVAEEEDVQKTVCALLSPPGDGNARIVTLPGPLCEQALLPVPRRYHRPWYGPIPRGDARRDRDIVHQDEGDFRG